MRVARVFHPGSPYAEPGDSLRDAAARMRGHALGALPVMSGNDLVGVLTERDVVEAAANGVRSAVAHVGDYMNDDAQARVSIDDDIATAGMKMLAIGCRHLPVVDHGRLVGMVSARDVFLASARSEIEGVLVS
jgi:CBS domain-containing protein